MSKVVDVLKACLGPQASAVTSFVVTLCFLPTRVAQGPQGKGWGSFFQDEGQGRLLREESVGATAFEAEQSFLRPTEAEGCRQRASDPLESA